MIEKAADTDMCEYLETHAHVHQTMYKVAFSCIAMLLLLLKSTGSYFCSTTTTTNKLN